MKLLFVTNLFPPHVVGGYEIGCLMNARAAQRAGHEVLVVTSMSVGSLNKQPQATGLDVRGVFEPVFDYEFGDRSYQRPSTYAGPGGVHPGNCLALAEVVRQWLPDAIWVHNPLGIGPVGILETAVGSGVPTVVQLMDFLDEGIRLSQHGFEVSGRWAAAKSRAHAIACSGSTLEANSRIGRYASAVVVPGGFESDAIPRLPSAAGRPALPPGGPVRMVSFGQLKSHKGVQHVVAALGVLRGWMGLDVELHLIGRCEAEFERELRAIARSAGCDRAVHWHGHMQRRELHELLETMHLAVLPLNEHEAFGYVAPEAAVHGLCVAFGRGAGCREVFPEDYPYLLSARDDPAAIAATVRRMIVDDEERRSWERRLPAYVADRCDLDRVVLPRCLDFIGGIVANHEPAGPRSASLEESLERTLATWQMNRNLGRLLGDEGPTPADKQRRLGRRINRALRRVVPPALQYRLKMLAGRLRRRRVA